LVSAPSLDLESKLTAEALYDQSISKLTLEERRKITRKITDRISKLFYSIVSRKMRPRNQVEQTYKKIRQSISELKIEKTEVQLRYLRSSRLLLAHDYCTDLES
jgi:septation ring formation regulator EzrA